MSLITDFLNWDNSALVLYFIGLAFVLIIIIGLLFLYAYYNKLLSKLPDAVKFKSLQSRINMLESKKDELTDELKKLEEKLAGAKGIIEEVENAKNWLENNKVTIPELENEITKRRNEYDKVLKLLDEESEKLQKSRKELQENEQQLSDKKAAASAAEIAASNAEKQVSELAGKADKLTKEIKELETNNQLALIEKNKLTKEVKDLQEKVEKLRLELEEKSNTVGQLKGEQAVVEGALKGYNKAIDNQQKTLGQSIQQLEELVKPLQPAGLDTRLEDLYRPVIEKPPALIKSIEEESVWLDQLHSRLEEHGIVFPVRAINAFHTSLKIADISPLVVLAGISGTGKSLLPQVYAKAIGMNFLSIAVQPRWDGPQDLFGFYNYMENRFKATELSRLVWQQDRYNNSDSNLHESMTLILLDEMNLARVEYYFSDMLSKLELRRNIDPKDPKSRALAEIELEAGSLSKKEKNKRLFVGSNILFVGTMNEDETTQMLSDKVIDRSNMLRFGKPRKNDKQPDTEKLLNVIQAEGLLKESTWQKWQRDKLPIQQQELLDEYLERINTAMADVGKPFGFRIHQAISQYVANYPEVENNVEVFNSAVADQIEMKIIPKLNGLEQGSGNADKLYGVIKDILSNEIKDQELTDEFNKVTNSEKPFFEWQGLSR